MSNETTTREKMKAYVLLTGSTEQATRLIQAEAQEKLAAAQEKLAAAIQSGATREDDTE